MMLDKIMNFGYAHGLPGLVLAALSCSWWRRIAEALGSRWSLAQFHLMEVSFRDPAPSSATSSSLIYVELSTFSEGWKGFSLHLSVLCHGLSFLFYLEDVFTCLKPTQATSLSSLWWNKVYTDWEVSVQISCSLQGSMSLVILQWTHPLVTFKVVEKRSADLPHPAASTILSVPAMSDCESQCIDTPADISVG